MKRVHLAALLGSLAFSLALLGQWPAFPGRDVDPSAPAPRAKDGRPDFSGVWESAKGAKGGPKGAEKGPEKGKAGKGVFQQKGAPGAGGTPVGGFQNLGVNFAGGLLPYTPAALALRNERLARNSADHPDAHCLPLNPIQLWFHPQPRKLIQTPGVTILLAEANDGLRQLFTDGRPLPKPADVLPWWFGYSTATWEGDTLVVESTGFPDKAWIDEQGSPMSHQARVTERIRRPNYGTLEVEITVNDPENYTAPFTVASTQRLLANQELIEFVCGENNTSLKHLVSK